MQRTLPLCVQRLLVAAVALVFLGGPLGACSDDAASVCDGPTIFPHESPKNLGDLRPLGSGEVADAGTPDVVPFEWTLFLLNICSNELEISEVCIAGDAHDGREGETAFALEGPVPDTVGFKEEAALRLTFDSGRVNSRDADDDGSPDPDNIAIVVQSNAINFPTLVVPVCARILPEGSDAQDFTCTSPVTVPAGEVDLSLCDDS